MERSAEVFNEVLRLHKQKTPHCAGLFTWGMATEKGLAWEPDWQCGTRFVGVCLSGTSAQAQAHSHQVERQPLLIMRYRWASVRLFG